MVSPRTDYSLEQPLPADVIVGGMGRVLGYRRFPVFSKPWLRGRILLFGIVIGLISLLSGVGNGVAKHDLGVGLRVGVLLFLSFMLMSFAGPMLAGWVRSRRWPEARERPLVVLAVVTGMLIAFFTDSWVSATLTRTTPSATPIKEAPQEPSTGLSASASGEAVVVNIEPGPRVRAANYGLLALCYFLLGGGLALGGYFSERRRWQLSQQQRELSQLRQSQHDSELRLGVLQAQVEPHFLFNSLAAVRSVVRENPARAEATLDALVDYLRATIPRLRGDVIETTLGAQIELCKHYLSVMQLRMGDRLSVDIELPESLSQLPFPPLILISLVENAVKHGAEPKPGAVAITLKADNDRESLTVTVSDDGTGLSGQPGNGIGLSNIRAQLAARYGEHAKLQIESGASGGVIASIRVPLAGVTA